MAEEFVPIIFFLVVGLVLVTYYYFRSKERQLMIEKGLSTEQIAEILSKKKDPLLMLKIGMVILFFGLGLGIGLLIGAYTGVDEWIPFLTITGIGLGFIFAYVFANKIKKQNPQE